MSTGKKKKKSAMEEFMTLTKYEGSPADRRADKSGKHGAEGSKKDMAADRAAVKKANKRK